MQCVIWIKTKSEIKTKKLVWIHVKRISKKEEYLCDSVSPYKVFRLVWTRQRGIGVGAC